MNPKVLNWKLIDGSVCSMRVILGSEKKQEKISIAYFEVFIIVLFQTFYIFEDVHNEAMEKSILF